MYPKFWAALIQVNVRGSKGIREYIQWVGTKRWAEIWEGTEIEERWKKRGIAGRRQARRESEERERERIQNRDFVEIHGHGWLSKISFIAILRVSTTRQAEEGVRERARADPGRKEEGARARKDGDRERREATWERSCIATTNEQSWNGPPKSRETWRRNAVGRQRRLTSSSTTTARRRDAGGTGRLFVLIIPRHPSNFSPQTDPISGFLRDVLPPPFFHLISLRCPLSLIKSYLNFLPGWPANVAPGPARPASSFLFLFHLNTPDWNSNEIRGTRLLEPQENRGDPGFRLGGTTRDKFLLPVLFFCLLMWKRLWEDFGGCTVCPCLWSLIFSVIYRAGLDIIQINYLENNR